MPTLNPPERPARAALGQRLVSGVGLAALVVGVAALLPAEGFAAFFLVLALVAAYEWAKLAGLQTRRAILSYVGAMAVVLATLWVVPASWRAALFVAGVFWLAAAGIVLGYPASAALARSPPVALIGGVVALAGAWAGLLTVRAAAGVGVVVWLFAVVAAADTGAYFAGRRFGRRKLAPRVSPGKTWAGTAGGALAALACGAAGAWWLGGSLLGWIGVGAAVFLASVVGDLYESVQKRLRGVKDSGALLPGHGGLLDRVDSLLPAAPALAILLPFAQPAL